MTLVFAYLDPGTGSLILQTIVGGFSGLLILARYLLGNRTKRPPAQRDAPSSGEIAVRLGDDGS